MRLLFFKMINQENERLFLLLLKGLTYTEIANRYYNRNKNKLLYLIRKLLKKFGLHNRRQLIYYAVTNGLIQIQENKENNYGHRINKKRK